MMRTIAPLLVLAMAACSIAPGTGSPPAASPHETPQAGTRLKQMWLLANDGSQTSIGWYDSTLETQCTWSQVVPGTWACVPDDVYTRSYIDYGSSLGANDDGFTTDAACAHWNTISISGGPSSCARYGIIRVGGYDSSPSASCGSRSGPSYYLVTPTPLNTPIYAYGRGGGQCCSCAPLEASYDRTQLFTIEPLTSANLGKLSLATAMLTTSP